MFSVWSAGGRTAPDKGRPAQTNTQARVLFSPGPFSSVSPRCLSTHFLSHLSRAAASSSSCLQASTSPPVSRSLLDVRWKRTFPIWDEESARLQHRPRNSRSAVALTKAVIKGSRRIESDHQRGAARCSIWCRKDDCKCGARRESEKGERSCPARLSAMLDSFLPSLAGQWQQKV